MKKHYIDKPDKSYTVSVAISAWNEEGNIKNILKDILSQNQDNWKLCELLVHCDGCDDRTVQAALEVKSKLVKIFDHEKRKGKVSRENIILKTFQGNILVLFDADVRLEGKNVISQLVEEFAQDPQVMLVGGNSQVYPPKSFFQKAIYTSYEVYYKSRESLKNGHNVLGCTGACLAMRSLFAKNVSIPEEIVTEDPFLYFSCLKQGFKFRHAKEAVVYFKMASNLKDFLRQVFRSHPESIKLMHKKYFGNLVNQEFQRPLGFYLRNIMKVFVKNPLGTMYMVFIKLCCKPLFQVFSRNYRLEWFTAASTK